MAEKREAFRFFCSGPPLVCPDCGEKTVFYGGSVLGEIIEENYTDEYVLARLYADTCSGTPFQSLCSECDFEEKKAVFWVEPSKGRIRGPLCQHCFVDFVIHEFGGESLSSPDIQVFYVKNNKTTKKALQEMTVFFQEDLEEPEELEVDPLNLF